MLLDFLPTDGIFAKCDEGFEINENDIRNSLIVEAKRRKIWTAKTISKMVFDDILKTFCYHVGLIFG